MVSVTKYFEYRLSFFLRSKGIGTTNRYGLCFRQLLRIKPRIDLGYIPVTDGGLQVFVTVECLNRENTGPTLNLSYVNDARRSVRARETNHDGQTYYVFTRITKRNARDTVVTTNGPRR